MTHDSPPEITLPNHVDIRLDELRKSLIDEVLRAQAIGLQIIGHLRESEDIEALAELRRLWARVSRVSVAANEIKTLLTRRGAP